MSADSSPMSASPPPIRQLPACPVKTIGHISVDRIHFGRTLEIADRKLDFGAGPRRFEQATLRIGKPGIGDMLPVLRNLRRCIGCGLAIADRATEVGVELGDYGGSQHANRR